MIKDIWLHDLIRTLVVNVQVMRDTFWCCDVSLAIFYCDKTNLMFQNPIKTCFVTNFLMIEWLLKMKPIVEQTFINLGWMTFVNTLCNTHGHKFLTKARYVWTNIREDKFSNTCANFVHIVKPILVTLKAFDNKHPCMEKHGLSWKH
jgi:hypothetical protein